jgi:hypothetical protein
MFLATALKPRRDCAQMCKNVHLLQFLTNQQAFYAYTYNYNTAV